jgi:hypothetical protein
VRYSSRVEVWSPASAATDVAANPAGWGSQDDPLPKPYEVPSLVQGRGTRQPSRPLVVLRVRSQIGSCRAAAGRSATSGRPSSSPWYR